MNLIKTSFGATSTADEVAKGIDLSGLRAVVTGASSGIGVETALSLARAGAQVTLAVRDIEAGRKIAGEIAEATGNRDLAVSRLDLIDRATIDRFVADWRGPLHLLINNAGIMAAPLERTPEGWELQFASNHLGHFALTLGLREALAKGFKERGEARIVALSSAGHSVAPVDFDDLQFERRPYDTWVAYAQSKTANALFAVEATRRWAGDGIVANAVNPGGIFTRLSRYLSEEHMAHWYAEAERGAVIMKTPQQGAATTMVAAIAPQFAHTGGHYLDDCNEAEPIADDVNPGMDLHRVRAWARDPAKARRLWDVSLQLIGNRASA
jgi:NAD(P)-dependent dehydrogenase (short-subunit alcohol dehydrogenase family)